MQKLQTLVILIVLLATIIPIAMPSAYAATSLGLLRPGNFMGLVGYWTFDGRDTNWTSATAGTTKDLSGNGNIGTLTNMSQDTSPVAGKIGQALNFDGVDDYVDRGTGPTSVNTVSFWVYPETTTEYFVNLTGTTDFVWLNAGTITATGFASPTIYVDGAVSSTLVARKWQYVAVTTVTSENASNLDIGRTEDANYLEGKIDDVRVYNRILNATEVRQLYLQGESKFNISPTNKLTNGLVGYWTFDGRDTNWTSATAGTTKDLSGNGNIGTLTNMSQDTSPVAGKIGQALNFDGVDDYVVKTSASRLPTTSGSMSMWVNIKSKPGGDKTFLDLSDGTANNEFTFYLTVGNLAFYAFGGGSGTNVWTRSHSDMNLNQWYHLVATWNTTTDSYQVYRDDNLLSPDTTSTAGNPSGINQINAGSFADGTALLEGILDEVRVYNRILSATEVKQLYLMGR